MYLYYNKPIILEDEYDFLLELKGEIPSDAVIIAPAQYHFSAWAGPVLQRDCLLFRSETHARSSLAPSLHDMLKTAYSTGDFEPLLSMIPREKAVVLFDSQRATDAVRLLNTGNWNTILEYNGLHALGLK
jgi:hypothetical protein